MTRAWPGNRRWAEAGAGALIALTALAPLACSGVDTTADQVVSTSTPSASSTTTATTATTTTAVPNDVEPATPAEVLVVDCGGADAHLSTKEVRVQPDGIHVTVRNTTDGDVVLNFVDRGDAVQPGVTETVQVMAPGPLVVSCGYDENRNIVAAGTVDAVDPDGIWQQTDIDCRRLPLAGWDGPMGSGSTPEDAVRWWLTERPEALVQPVSADGEIVSVGYPEAASPLYVTRRDGRDADIFRLEQTDGTWSATPHEGCPRR